MRSFVEPGLAAGWIVLAVDPAKPNSDAANDNLILRYSLIKAVLLAIQASWPESGRWPIAFGGFSGGAKASGFLALISAIDGRLPIGIFLGGCNEATPADALNIYHRPQPGFASVPVFLSSGINDTIASPSQQRNVKEDLLNAGFTRVRLESYQGEHHLSPEHLQAALQWFDAEAARQPE
jgi:predicted esterase